MHEEHEVHYWTKHFAISREELQRAVDKVGNSAAAVSKEFEARYFPKGGARAGPLQMAALLF